LAKLAELRESNVSQHDHLAELAKALAHPARLRILQLLKATPGCIGGDIVDAVGLAQSTVSEHLRILKVAGVISGEIDGPRICYALNPEALAPLAAFLATLTPPPGDACCVPNRKETQ
jgi:ArsR family transcriptional regulator